MNGEALSVVYVLIFAACTSVLRSIGRLTLGFLESLAQSRSRARRSCFSGTDELICLAGKYDVIDQIRFDKIIQ